MPRGENSVPPPLVQPGTIRGTWEVIRFSRRKVYHKASGATKSSIRFYLCRCLNCKNEIEITSANIGKWGCQNCMGLTRSSAGFNRVMDYYRRNARNNHRELTLTADDFLRLFSSACYYCGSPPLCMMTCNKYHPGKKSTWGDFYYNGIDRIDGTLGYIPGNCLPCCHFCNRARNSRPFEEFRDYWLLIHKRIRDGFGTDKCLIPLPPPQA